jgi:hypothetical protein
MKGILETWFVFSVAIWIINGLSLIMLPQPLWDWFYLIPFFVGTSLNLGFSLNIYLNKTIQWKN